MSLAELRKGGYVMDEHGWLNVRLALIAFVPLLKQFQRILFLESVAGVPGMVAATIRHLRSLRLMVGILPQLIYWLIMHLAIET